jgi:hypothetical protein
VAGDLGAVPARSHVAPDAAAVARTVEEDPAAQGVAADPQAIASRHEVEQGGQQLVGQAVPAQARRADCAAGLEPVRGLPELVIEGRRQGIRRPGRKRPDGAADGGQAVQDGLGGEARRDVDRVVDEEADEVDRVGEVVVGRIAGPRASMMMPTGPVGRIGDEDQPLERGGTGNFHRPF